MSLAAAARKAYAVDAEEKSVEFRKASTQSPVESGIEKITAWIPSEVVAIYVALVGIFAPGSETTKWVIFGIGAVCVPTFVGLNAALVNKQGKDEWSRQNKEGSPPRIARKRIGLLIAFGLVAFVVWAFALPATPFLTITDSATKIGGALVIVMSLLMPLLAKLADLEVKEGKS